MLNFCIALYPMQVLSAEEEAENLIVTVFGGETLCTRRQTL